jgi:DNA-binding transcriptional MerR regulator
MLEPDDDWSVRDLAEQAGTTVRTVHYYIAEGLIPPPQGTTRNASYSVAHLARLRLIAALRDEGLALASIRQRLAPLSDEQALEVAAELDEHLSRAGETPLTTLGLIEAALSTRINAEIEVSDAVPPMRFASMSLEEAPESFDRQSASNQSRESAREYLDRVQRRPSPPRPASPVPLPRPQLPARKPQETDRPETWHHFRIEDGIELRVREDRYRESKGRLRAVIDTLRTTLGRYGLAQRDHSEH